MRLKLCLFLIFFVVIHSEFAASYKNEIEITPSPIEEATTKKSGFFGGIKNFFRGSPTTSTTVAPILLQVTTPKTVPPQTPRSGADLNERLPTNTGGHKPPPLVITHAPLMPLGPRPDTPPSSPLAGNQQQPPQWPQPRPSTPIAPHNLPPNRPTDSTNPIFGSGGRPSTAEPNMPPGFRPYHPPRPLPSGLDLSYGGNANAAGGHHQPGGRPGAGLATINTHFATSTTTTTTPKSIQPGTDHRNVLPHVNPITSTTTITRPQNVKEDFPSLPPPRRPSIDAKEDFPALPVPKSPTPTPSAPQRPSSPSAWNNPIPTPSSPVRPGVPTSIATPTPSSPTRPNSPSGSNGVSFVPHSPSRVSTTTVRPGFESAGNSLATDDEIRTLTENLFTKEVNSQLNLIRVNVQGKTRSIDSGDEAPQPLLEVDSKALESPTIAKMQLLFNNYESDTLTNEYVTPNERKEENDFVDAVMGTSVMRQAMQFLQTKGIVSPDPKTHRDLIKELWFTQYSRGSGKIGSSGFEHVFVNEVKNGTIIGLHNWVYFYEEEKAGRLDYKGYMNQLDLGSKGKVLKLRFTHNNLNKPVNTLFIGTSPELELALYTVCFKLRPDRTCPVSLDNKKFGIVVYSWRYRGKSLIGSAYPEI